MSFRTALTAGALLLATMVAGASAQTYPSQTIRMIAPFPAGGATDVVARLIGERLGERLGATVVVENKAGAGGNIGTAAAAAANPDGYTIVLSTSGPLAINKSLYKSLPYDPEKDFEPLSLIGKLPNVLVVNPKAIPVKTVSEFIDFVKARPGQVSFSSIGNGSSQHLAALLFQRITNTKMVHVPYRSSPGLIVDLVSGQVPTSFQNIPNIISQLGSGEIRAIAVASRERTLALPNTPTMAEQGVPDFESFLWLGLLAPKGTPKPITDRLYTEISKIMGDPAVRKRMIEIGVDPVQSTPQELRAFISAEVTKWRTVISEAGVPQIQ